MHHVKLLRIVLAAILAVAAPLAVAGTANAASEAVATTVSSYDVSDATVVEGDDAESSLTFTITRSGNTSVSTTIHPYTQDVTTTRKIDYVPVLSTTPFTFAAGETARTLTVQVKPDLFSEPDETVRLRLLLGEAGDGHRGIGIGTIVDNEPPAGPNVVSINDVRSGEGDPPGSTAVHMVITRTGDLTGSAAVSYRTVQDTATRGVDYADVSSAAARFAPGQGTVQIVVWISGDTAVESDESFQVELFDPIGSGTSIDDGTGVVTIVNDDFPPPPPSYYDVSDATMVEADDAESSLTFTITRSGNTSVSTTIHPYTQDVTATRKVDYVPILSTTPFTFAAGETTKTVTVQIKSDLIDEPDETLRLRLLLGEAGTGHKGIGIGTIVGNLPPPGPSAVSINDVSSVEGSPPGWTAARLTITRTGDLTGSAAVSYRTAQDTATSGYDFYEVSSATARFAQGQGTAQIVVGIPGDTAVESDESFRVELFDPVGTGTFIDDGTGVVTIINDDAPPPPPPAPSYYDVSDATVVEGDDAESSLTFTITRSGNTSVSTTVHPYTQDVTTTRKVDYVPILSTTPFTFAAGETTRTVTVQIKPDLISESDETLRLRLLLGEAGTGHRGIGIGTIADNDRTS